MLCDERKKFVYEVSDIFGTTFTLEEMGYWIAFNRISIARLYDIDIMPLDYDQVGKEINRKIIKRKVEIERLSKGAAR